MKDLKALIAQKGYQEVLQHLNDVAPSDRNQEWTDIAGRRPRGTWPTPRITRSCS